MMKLTYRDKVIAIVLTVILILAAGAVFLVRPEIQKFQDKQIELETKQKEKETVQNTIDTLPVIQMRIIQSLSDIEELQDPFYLEAKDYEFEQLFHEYTKGNADSADEAAGGVESTAAAATTDGEAAEGTWDIKNISWELIPADLLAYQYMPQHGILGYDMKIHADLYGLLPQEVLDIYNEVKMLEKPASVVGAMMMEVEFDEINVWEDFTPFLDLIAGLDRTIIINSVALGEEPDPETGEGGTAIVKLTIFNIVPMDIESVIEHEREIAEENGTLPELDSIIERMRNGTLEPLPAVTESTAATTTTAAQ